MKRIIATIIALAMLCTFINVQAAGQYNINVINELGSTIITTEVNLGIENPYTLVSFALKQGRTPVYIDAGITDENGKITFIMDNTGSSGNYSISLDAETLDYNETFHLNGFKGLDYYLPFITAVETAVNNVDANSLLTAIENLAVDVQWDLTEYNSFADKLNVYKLFLADAKDEYKTVDDIKADFIIACKLQKILETKNGALLKSLYNDDITDKVVGLYNALPVKDGKSVLELLSNDHQNAIFETAAKTTFTNRVGVCNALKLNALFVPIMNALHYENVKIVIEAYDEAGVISVDTESSYAIDVYKSMMTNQYYTFNAVEEGYNNLLNSIINKNQSNSNSNSNSNSGLGGGKGSVSNFPVLPPQDSENNQTNTTVIPTVSADNKPQMSFVDMEDSKWALDAVENLYKKGIIAGVGNNKFAPHENVTRTQFAKMAVMVGNYTIASMNSSFSDVVVNEWYVPYVSTAYQNGLFVGNEDGSFGVNTPISREQIAVVVYRMLKDRIQFNLENYQAFEDDYLIDNAYKEAVYALKSINVITGRSATTFCPDENVTRVEAAVLLNRVANYF